MDSDGTCSNLDIVGISDEPEFGCACPLSDEQLTALFGTTQPTNAIDIVVYENGKPAEYFFAGCSFD